MQTNLVVFSVAFNQDLSAFTVATSRGFKLYKTHPVKLLGGCDLDQPIKICEIVYKTNIYALVGSNNLDPAFNTRTVTYWDNYRRTDIRRQVYQSEVTGVKMRNDRVVVAAENSIFVYSLMDLRHLRTLTAGPNPLGLLAYSHDTPYVLACPHPDPGTIYILKGESDLEVKTHKRELSAIALNKPGTMVATTSSKGTIIRIFSTSDLTQLFEFRRGVSSTAITSLVFHQTESFLACSSLKGTVHIYRLVEGGNKSSMVSFARAILPSYFSSEWSILNFRAPEGHNKVALTKEGNVVVVRLDGSVHFGSFLQALHLLLEVDRVLMCGQHCLQAQTGECASVGIENYLAAS
jgi:WD40 repeat protein